MTLTGNADKIKRRVSFEGNEPTDDQVTDSIHSGIQQVLAGLRRAGVNPGALQGGDETLLNEAVDYYATAELLQILYNPTDDDGTTHVQYYLDRADAIMASVVERAIIEEQIKDHNPYSGVRSCFYFNSRYNDEW